MLGVDVRNWTGAIRYRAHSVEVAESIDDVVRIVTDPDRYPSPVRAKGSHHSTTRCVVAESGTVIDMTRMNRILDIDADAMTITMQAGVLHIDAARALERQGLQFYVNCEIGNLTVGSGACGGTKDASFHSADEGWEYGQVASYVAAMTVVQADGSLRKITEAEPDLLAAMRSSYGMLGIVVEVTFRVKEIRPMAVEHVRYELDDFVARLDDLLAENRSMMLYLFPFLDSVVVEYRSEGSGPIRSNGWQWRLRNTTWSTLWPGFAKTVTRFVPFRQLRSWIIDAVNRLTQMVMVKLIKADDTSPADQIIRYADVAGYASYTFSIWAFPQNSYGESIRAYYAFCRDYFRDHGYRCDLMNVGYYIAQDRQSLFSYTREGPALTLDPVSTGAPGWHRFVTAYNRFCIDHGGKPLFNQSPNLTRDQAQAAFGPEIASFRALRQSLDPTDRFYNAFFRRLFETD